MQKLRLSSPVHEALLARLQTAGLLPPPEPELGECQVESGASV